MKGILYSDLRVSVQNTECLSLSLPLCLCFTSLILTTVVHDPHIIHRLIRILLVMNTSVGTSPPVLFQYPGDHERTRIRMIRYVGFFFAWKSIQFFTKCRWILTVTLSLPRVKNVKIWCFELCKVSNSNVSIIKPCAHPANLEYLVANSWCLQKPYSMFEDPGAVSWVRKYGGESFQERVRDPLGRYS